MVDPAIGEGARATQAATRNAAIDAAAWELAGERKWPSPAAVARRTGISVSVVERETARLFKARRRWVRLVGRPHPQWRDPDEPVPTAGQAAPGTAAADGEGGSVTEAPDVALAAGADAAGEDRETPSDGRGRGAGEAAAAGGRQRPRATERKLRKEIALLREVLRRAELGVRPAEVQAILDAGAKHRPAGEADQGVGGSRG